MRRIRLYRHPACDKCARLAQLHWRLDWLDRFEDSTQIPPTGSLHPGEIVLQDLDTLETCRGVEALRGLCRHIPLHSAMLPFSYVPGLREWLARRMGCPSEGARDTSSIEPAGQS